MRRKIILYSALTLIAIFAFNFSAFATSSQSAYSALLEQKTLNFNFFSILKGILGMTVLLGIAFFLSSDRKKIDWSTVAKALLLQFVIAISIITLPVVQQVFEFIGKGFIAILGWTDAGSNFLFGPLMSDNIGYIFALRILPTIIFFAALTSLFYYLGILQRIVAAMGWCLTRVVRLSGAESLSCVGNVFLGMTEAPLMVKTYIPTMNKSEIALIMISGMSTMSGGILAVYINMLAGGDPALELEFAKHLLSASIMAAPGAIAFAKIIQPQSEKIDNKVEVSKERVGSNFLDSIAVGTSEGLRLAVNIAAMLLVFYALIAGFNAIFGGVGDLLGLNKLIASSTNGQFTALSLQYILSLIFSPVIWLTGLPTADAHLAGQLLGEKIIMTEFVGYDSLSNMIRSGAFSSSKSIIMSTYILCGFANFASIGILIGGVGGLAPNQRPFMSSFGLKSLLASTLVALMSAVMIGMLI